MNASLSSRNAWNPSKNTLISRQKDPSSTIKTILVFALSIVIVSLFGLLSLMG